METKKILIVDDDVGLGKNVERRLETAGFSASWVISAEDAFEKLDSDPPDLIILDMVLPYMSGLGFLREIKNNPTTSRIPVIVVSNVLNADVEEVVHELGALTALAKSCCKISDILTAVRVHMDGMHPMSIHAGK